MFDPSAIIKTRWWRFIQHRYEVLRAHAPAGGLHPTAYPRVGPMAGYVVPRVELDELATLDSGTFGRTYHTHLMKNGLSPFRVDDQLNEQMRRCLFSMRYRVMHDVIHVLTGFDTSYAGEVGVLAFAVSQRYCRIQKLELGMALMMAPAMTPAGLWTVYRNARLGRQLGRSADFLLNYRFEEDLRLPLDEVIEKVGLDRLDRAA